MILEDGFRVTEALAANEFVCCIVKKLPQIIFDGKWGEISERILSKLLKYEHGEQTQRFCLEITQHDLNRDESGKLSHFKIHCSDPAMARDLKIRFDSKIKDYILRLTKTKPEDYLLYTEQLNQT